MPSIAHTARGAHRFRFAGVESEFLCPSNFSWTLPSTHERFITPGEASGEAPHVICSVTMDASLTHDTRGTREIVVSSGKLQTKGVYARLSQIGRTRWAASARVAPGPHAMGRLLDGLSAAVIEQGGGVLLHAAGVELAGRAYLFIGPSGSGKTTAAGQVFGGRQFTVDRAAVLDTGRGPWAVGLPGGSAPADGLARSERTSLPLGAVLCVVKAHALAVRPMAPPEALMALRACVFSADRDPAAEDRRLEALLRLCVESPIVRLENAWGAPLAQTLRQLGRAA